MGLVGFKKSRFFVWELYLDPSDELYLDPDDGKDCNIEASFLSSSWWKRVIVLNRPSCGGSPLDWRNQVGDNWFYTRREVAVQNFCCLGSMTSSFNQKVFDEIR